MAKPGKDEARLEQELAALPSLPRQELLERYHSLYKTPAPARISQPLLRLAIAHRLQVQVHGGLSPAVQKRLMSGDKRPKVQAGAGTLLVREWQGVHHTVAVQADHVEYAGNTYRSLSEVARHITGVRRSGPAFFGLRG